MSLFSFLRGKRFVKEGSTNKAVRDRKTGLVWATNDSIEGLQWDDAVTYCNNFMLEGLEWRLPQIVELATLYDKSFSFEAERWNECSTSPFNIHVNPIFALKSDSYWSSIETTRSLDGEHAAWYFSFSSGEPYEGAKASGLPCIRALPVHGQPLESLPEGIDYDTLLIHKHLFTRE